jgi:hypothetical protein
MCPLCLAAQNAALARVMLAAHADLIEAVREGAWGRVADAVETMRPTIDAALASGKPPPEGI